jgi:hypothetical protein
MSILSSTKRCVLHNVIFLVHKIFMFYTGAAKITPTFGGVTAQAVEGVQ